MKSKGYTYSIKKKAKDKGDYRLTKHGLVAEFSLRELNRNIEQLRKQVREVEANARLQESLAENIRRANHDLVQYMKKLTPKKRFSLTLLAIQENKAKQFKDQERTTKSILNSLVRENTVIRKQLKL